MSMKREMTLTELKKYLSNINDAEMKKLLCHIYKNSEMAEKMMNVFLLGSNYENKLLKDYREKMYKVFFPNDIIHAGFSLAWAKSLVSEFKKIGTELELVLELQLYYVECGTDFTNAFGDIDMAFYNSMCSVYHTVIQAVNHHENNYLYQKFEKRLYHIVKESEGIGWGYHDYVSEEFFNIRWREK